MSNCVIFIVRYYLSFEVLFILCTNINIETRCKQHFEIAIIFLSGSVPVMDKSAALMLETGQGTLKNLFRNIFLSRCRVSTTILRCSMLYTTLTPLATSSPTHRFIFFFISTIKIAFLKLLNIGEKLL